MFSGSIISQIKKLAEEYSQRDDQYLTGVALDLGFESRQSDDITPLLPRGFALVQVAASRQLGMQHYDCQLQGGYVMCRGNVAEMKTGEGKTLTATLPMFVHALAGRGALLATSNDYLAERDAHEMAPLYRSLGLTVGVIKQQMSREQRRAAYQCHITYGTMSEFGFDFLKDHSKQREQKQRELWYGGAAGGVAESSDSKPVHREPHFLLIDEADSILIDDARTPLIISAPADSGAQQQQQTLYAWTAQHTDQYIEDEHYWYDREKRSVDLTPEGTALVRSIRKPAELAGVGLLEMYDFVERAIQVARDFKMDRDYVIRDGEVVIVDESTGRIAEGRRWSRGIHQAIEAKERVEITLDTSTAAKITVQSFVSRFPFIAGMTGTAYTSRKEFKKIYHTGVEIIPTNKPRQRIEHPIKFFHTEAEKFQQVVLDTAEIHNTGRPILIGTRSIAKSEQLSILLREAGVEHEVLNAREVEREAQIVESAGEFARVTVATNMAGRGTDIKINAHVRELGGMHVIGTEMHESSRIDQQLFGRCGRQGDPGSVQLYIAAEDKLLESAFGRQTAQKYRRTGKNRIASYWIALFNKAQQKLENQHYRSRRILMHSEKQMAKAQREMGLDPILDNFE